jgi:hypothetical protein
MPKRSSIGKRRSKALPALGFAGMSLSMASGACASTSEASANTSRPSQKHELFLGEEEISDVSSAASKGNAADTASKEEASTPHELNGVRHSRLSQALRDRLTTS